MKISDIPKQRLHNQHLAITKFKKPGDVVAWLGAVQAQDFPGSLWAIGLRTQNALEADIHKAIAERSIVRTWPMRGTLHFVAATDAHWMLKLLASRVIAGIKRRSQQMELTEADIIRSEKILVRALEGGNQLTRGAMYKLLENAGISTTNSRGLHILGRLAHERLICFGAREGKQPTFVLLDEWVPAPKHLERDEALAELARRYFTSHAPATLQDFVWWSGLTMTDARTAIDLAKAFLVQENLADVTYWMPSSMPSAKLEKSIAFLLPPFDEYTVAYKDRSAVLDPMYANFLHNGNGIFSPIIVINGQVVGIWKRTVKKEKLIIQSTPFTKFSKAQTRSIRDAANRYGEFIKMPVVVD
ncbi:MAG: winged helix DNA-binding domain-containing protein [Acidobacteriota bacterium]